MKIKVLLVFALLFFVACANEPPTLSTSSASAALAQESEAITSMRTTLLAGGHPPKEIWVTFALGDDLGMHWFFSQADAKTWMGNKANVEQYHGPFSGPHHATLNGYDTK